MYERSIPFEATIRWIKRETRDTSTYALSINSKEIQKVYKFKPGQFNMLYIPGIGESPISISSAPSDKELTHTIRVAGDVTTAISKLKAGDIIGVRGPFGTGWPMDEIEDRFLLVIAGGLGIAPLRSVFRELSKGSKKIGALLYGAKTPKDVIFRDELPRYRDFFDLFLTVDKADPEEYWRGHVGIVTDLLGKVTFNPLNTIVFVCGPEVMMQNVISTLILRGVPAEKIFLSMERNMNCGMGTCGHCMFGPKFVCKNGPVFRFSDVEELLGVKEI
jgi:NAD(P)H-flavin reductase